MAVALVAVSCASTPVSAVPSRGAQASAPASSTPRAGVDRIPDLAAELLTTADLPAGWSTDTAASAGAGSRGCIEVASSTPPQGEARATFSAGTAGLPVFAESLGWFAHDAHAAFTGADQALARCRSTSFRAGGQEFHGSVAALPFPSFGDESAAFDVSVSAAGQAATGSLGLELVLARKGAILVSTELIDAGMPDAVTLSQLTARALAKLR
jgi:hypothetical protein